MLNYEHSTARRLRGGRDKNGKLLLCMSLLFLVGAFCGCVFGGTIGTSALFSDMPSQNVSFWGSLFDYCKYHLAACLFGTSFLGLVLLPLLCFLRGYALALSAASLLTGGGLLTTFLSLLPGELISIACFFVVLQDAFSYSVYLLGLVQNRRLSRLEHPFLHSLLCVLFLFCGNAVNLYLVPKLLSMFH